MLLKKLKRPRDGHTYILMFNDEEQEMIKEWAQIGERETLERIVKLGKTGVRPGNNEMRKLQRRYRMFEDFNNRYREAALSVSTDAYPYSDSYDRRDTAS